MAISIDVISNFLMERFFFILPITLMFDVRDMESDPMHLATIPRLIGVKGTKLLAILSLIIAFLFALQIEMYSEYLVEMILLYVMMFVSILASSRSRAEFFYSAWFDGLMGVHALIVILNF